MILNGILCITLNGILCITITNKVSILSRHSSLQSYSACAEECAPPLIPPLKWGLCQMPPPYFLVFLLSCPLLLSLCFSFLYLLDPSGLEPSARSHFFSASPLEQRMAELLGPHLLLTFFYSLSIATTMGGGPMEARSPFCLLVANLETLCAQLIFVFLSGAVFQRLSQPVSLVKWSKVALIADDKWSGSGVKAHK